MKLGHYVVIQQGRRLIPGRRLCRLFYRSALDRQIHDLIMRSDDARFIRSVGLSSMYAITDDLYQQILSLTLTKKNDEK